ncbi:hypothetical protein TRICI_003157 [Trichomonascus ciferrii]|uniref:Uncharacterized protein n=1 Tax=Trichomonascus ciferrii TaxID=44093 RepID=A0A642V4I5_9ASCO|nr:hypothetical protein TRICI_003157 [Trichomonascus ciferrii]
MPSQTGSGGGRLRVYSDFRIARVRIGSFDVVEPCTGRKNERDSRIRLYFNTTNEQSFGNPSMSARERALAEPDRLSITLYQGTKRMIIPVQDGLKKIVYNREKGHFRILSKGWALFEEIDPSVSPHPAPNKGTAFFRKCADLTDGELEKSEGVIEVWVDKKNPLPMEPKWTRGNIRDYVDSRSKFRTQNILEVEDPEHINDFDGIVQLWVRESTISSVVERQHFVRNKLSRLEYILELSSKILAPPHYYVSKNTNTTNPQVASVLESGQIPALISPAISTLIATTVNIASKQAGMADEALMQSLKVVLFQAPEPIIWRALDGLFGKRNELLNFNPEKILELALQRSSATTPTTSATPSTANTPPVKHEDTYDDQQPNTNDQNNPSNDQNNNPSNDQNNPSNDQQNPSNDQKNPSNDPPKDEDEDDEVTYEA